MLRLLGSLLMLSRCASFTIRTARRLPQRPLFLHNDRDADLVEQLVGGKRYEVTQLPDSMIDTTLFVGNLCEFVHDDDLSQLFQAASRLQSVPACVARKADMSSLQYGFVSFLSKEEKEAAIMLFDGFEWRGKALKVEPIRDHPKMGRVKVPERMVHFVSGATKRTRSGKTNDLRRISRDDVERLSKGQPSKKKGYGSRNVPHRLNEAEMEELQRAARKGYVTVSGGGNRRTRKGSPLLNIHRQWCDAREKPQIVLYKSTHGDVPKDQVVVDLSPLRLHGLFDDATEIEEFLTKWKVEVHTAACEHGMDCFDDECDLDDEEEELDTDATCNTEFAVVVDERAQEAWATQAIWKLPPLSIGTFLGQRSDAKAMAKTLAELWEIPELEQQPGGGPNNRRNAGAKKGGKTKMKGLSQHRKRGGGHRQSFY